MSLSPTSISIAAGGSATAGLLATSTGTFSSPITVQANNLPAGVTITPATITLTPGTSLLLTFSAATSVSGGSDTVTFAGTSGSLTQSVNFSLTLVGMPVSAYSVPYRMRYLRTDATTGYPFWLNPSWTVYNPPTSRFFVTDPGSNHVFVLDASTESLVGTIMVPGAFGIDDTPDHKTLYVGTLVGDIYVLDPVSMTVTKRYPSAQIGPNGFNANLVEVMADGRLAVLGAGEFAFEGLENVDGYESYLGFWNPADNSMSTPIRSGNGAIMRTPDRTKIVSGEPGSPPILYVVDESTESVTTVGMMQAAVERVSISPDGKWLVVPVYPGQAAVYNASTVSLVSTFDIAGDASDGAEFFVGPDSQTLYVSSETEIYAYNLTTGQQVGWFPNLYVNSLGGGLVVGPTTGPAFQAIDSTGLLVGPMEEGVGFLDTKALRTGPAAADYQAEYTPLIQTGPTAGGTQTSWTEQIPAIEVLFGSQAAVFTSSSETVTATSPAGFPGPADVGVLHSDGGFQLMAEQFSYGPTILEVTPNAATADGGAGTIFGYGFGPTSTATSAPVPANLQVTVGGAAAAITSYVPNAYGADYSPFPLQAITYTIPPGTAGSSSDVTLTSSSGSVTVSKGMTYLPATRQYPLSGAALVQGVYDPQQDVYYFTDATKIQVFSRTQGAWLAPITIPAPYAPTRLWGIAISPDGSKLAVGDSSADYIYVLNPASPSQVKGFAVPELEYQSTQPLGLAVSDSGIVYYWTASGALEQLNASTGAVSMVNICETGSGICAYGASNYLRIIISADNSTLYANSQGTTFMVDLATGINTFATLTGSARDDDLALSANQTRISAAEFFYDSSLNLETYLGLNFREMMNISYIYGEKLSPDGTLLFQPTTTGIDVLDARLGNLVERIAIPVSLSPSFDALVVDGKDNVLVGITGATGNGVALIDLSSIPSPAPLPYEVDSKSDNRISGPRAVSSGQRLRPENPPSASPLRTVPHVTVHTLLPVAVGRRG